MRQADWARPAASPPVARSRAAAPAEIPCARLMPHRLVREAIRPPDAGAAGMPTVGVAGAPPP